MRRSTRAGASAGALVRTFTTPGGKPASLKTSPISRCVPGQISDALSTTELPQASAVATARTPRMIGAFHGAMPRQTPAGWRTDIARHPGLSDGITSPAICVVSDAASRSMPVASLTLKADQISVVPISAIMIRTKASRLASSAAAAFSNRARLAFGPSADHPGNAAEAAATAASASEAVAAAARLATSCDSGLRRSNTLPLEAA